MTLALFVDLFCGAGGREPRQDPNNTIRDTSIEMSGAMIPDTVTFENVEGTQR